MTGGNTTAFQRPLQYATNACWICSCFCAEPACRPGAEVPCNARGPELSCVRKNPLLRKLAGFSAEAVVTVVIVFTT